MKFENIMFGKFFIKAKFVYNSYTGENNIIIFYIFHKTRLSNVKRDNTNT